MKKNKEFFELNDAQLAVVVEIEYGGKKYIYLEWGRGTGKSFILAYIMLRMVQQMPGATFAFVGPTYQQILSKMLPSTKNALEVMGIYEGMDYVIGKNGAKQGFATPIYSPDKWDNIMHWSNGCTFQFVSVNDPNSGRGLNSFGEVGDEAALFDHDKLYDNVTITNRAKEERFENCPLLGVRVYASSTPMTKKGKWFTDKEKECMLPENVHNHIFIKASSEINKHNLQDDYWDRVKRESSSILKYNAEILNIRPKQIQNGFYLQLQPEKHYYNNKRYDYLESVTAEFETVSFNCATDNDVVNTRPLILSIDWGVFLSAVVSQDLPHEYRVLKEFWASQSNESQDLEDLVDEFDEYYKSRENKVTHLYYGHDGNAKFKKGTNVTYGDMLVSLLKSKGWTVYDKSKRKPVAPHNDKYMLINMMLKESSTRFKKIRINEQNCQNLIISLERAEASEDRNGIQKVKKDERNASMKQQHTTHLSDAFDIPVYSLFKSKLKKDVDSLDLPTVIG